jgi:hypothetical protein
MTNENSLSSPEFRPDDVLSVGGLIKLGIATAGAIDKVLNSVEEFEVYVPE